MVLNRFSLRISQHDKIYSIVRWDPVTEKLTEKDLRFVAKIANVTTFEQGYFGVELLRDGIVIDFKALVK